jgi:DnaK suppressor protein
MTSEGLESDLAARLRPVLARRERELSAYLRKCADEAAAASEEPAEARDFKDLAAKDVRAVIDAAAGDHAARELAGIRLAQRRLRDGTYGYCEDCGDPIAENRLLAMPATRYCCACQSVHERRGFVRR